MKRLLFSVDNIIVMEEKRALRGWKKEEKENEEFLITRKMRKSFPGWAVNDVISN